MAANTVETVLEMYRLFAQRDNEGIQRLFDPEIEWVQMEGLPDGGHYVGAGAIFEGAFTGLREQWKDWSALAERYLDAGESVVALDFYEGTHRSTGSSMRAEFAHLVEFKDGRIVRLVQYTDTLKVAEAMNLVREE